MEEKNDKAVVAGLIEKATKSTRPEVDPRLLKAIKSVVRRSDSELRLAAQTVMSFMKRNHSQVRYLTLLIIDELFMRSKLFRTLIVENLDQLLTLSVGFRNNLPLPAPAAVASILRTKAIEFLEKWNMSFGIHYRQIRLGYDYLKNTLSYQFPELQANAARIQQERNERERRTKEILLNKFEYLKINLPSIRTDIQSTIDEISECIEIIRSDDDNMPLAYFEDDGEIEEFRNDELRHIRIDSLKEGEKVQENSENEVVFDALRELYKVLLTKHLVAVQEWISVLIRVEAADDTFRDTSLKELIDIQNHLKSVKKKCEDLGFAISKTTAAEEEDIWEDGSLDSLAIVSSAMTDKSSELCVASSSNQSISETVMHNNNGSNGSKKLNRDRGGIEADSLRSKLLAEAPEVNWCTFLDYWDSNQDVLANQRGLELESHWGRVDYDAVIPAKRIADLSVPAIPYKEDPVEIQPCRAPLGKGGLCQRRDLRECPFHGPVIPRDSDGNPVNLNPSSEEVSPPSSVEEVASELVEQLARKAVRNVRERDREEAKKREYDRWALKRAKLAAVRDHNEAVLRDAAMASTWRSSHVGEDPETANNGRSGRGRNKSDTLASMLKKKETAKTRLTQKLLNTQVMDATVKRLTMQEDRSYKEAFHNQW